MPRLKVSFKRGWKFQFSIRISPPIYSPTAREIECIRPFTPSSSKSITGGDGQSICTDSSTEQQDTDSITSDNEEYEIQDSIGRSKIRAAMNDIRKLLREALRVTREVSIVFPPLQSVAGGLLVLVELFQIHIANKEELHRIRARLEQFAYTMAWFEESEVVNEALRRLLTSLEVQLTRIRYILDERYFRRLISARDIAADICKMLRDIDDAFILFQAELALEMSSMLQCQLRQQRHTIATSITSITFDADHTKAENFFTPGTMQWFFELPCFDEWKQGKHPILWCYGNPGVGKTVLTGQIVRRLEEVFSGQNVAILYAYCNHQDVTTILGALLRQLLHRSAQNQRPHTVWNFNTPLSLNDMVSAIEAEIATYQFVFLVVDALDKLDLPKQSELLRRLRSLLGSGCLRLLFTSRPNVADLFSFKGVAKIEISTCRSDLILFVRKQIEEAEPTLKDAVNRITTEKFTDIVIRKADGMFLMARSLLESLNRCYNYQMVVDSLESAQPLILHDTYDTYDITLNRIYPDHRELVLQILSWLSFSEGPRTMEDLSYALAASKSRETFNTDNLIAPKCLLRLCAGFLCATEVYDLTLGPIYTCTLPHYTIHEYIRKIRDRLLSSQDMLSVCVKYLTCIPPACASGGKKPPFFVTAARSVPIMLRDMKDTCNDSFMSDSCFASQLFGAMEDLFGTDHDGAHFIHFAAFHDLCHVIRHLTSRDLSLVNLQTKDGYTPLTYAVISGSRKAVETLLITPGVDVNARNKDGRTPLSYAAELGDEDIFIMLLGFADILVDPRDENGRTPLSYAASSASPSAFTIVMTILSKDVDINSRDKDGRTPLSYAASSVSDSAPAIVEALLATKGIDMHSKDYHDRTSLSYAASSESRSVFRVIQAFLRFDGILISVESKDKYGRTPLSYAASSLSYSAASIVKSLLAVSELEASLQDEQGRTPLSYAASSCSPSSLYTVEALLAVDGTDINSGDKHGRTPLSYAVSSTSYSACSVVQALLGHAKGADVNSRDGNGRTILSYAMSSTSYSASSIIKSLLAVKDIDVHSRDGSGRDVLSYAASSWSHCISSTIKVLLAIDGIDVNSKDACGRCPLSYAASSGSLWANSVVETFLVDEDIDVNSRDNTGRTPLFYAAASTSNCAVLTINTLLASNSASCDLKDYEGRSPLSYATSGHVRQVLLRAATAQGCYP